MFLQFKPLERPGIWQACHSQPRLLLPIPSFSQAGSPFRSQLKCHPGRELFSDLKLTSIAPVPWPLRNSDFSIEFPEIEVIIITVGYFQCTGSFYIRRQKSLYLQETFMYYCRRFSRSVMSNSLETPQTTAPQAPLSTGFPRQEYWSGLPLPCLGDLLDPGIKPTSLPYR